jgi:hypothetical protein
MQSAARTTRLVIMYAGPIIEVTSSFADSPQCDKDAMRLPDPLGAAYGVYGVLPLLYGAGSASGFENARVSRPVCDARGFGYARLVEAVPLMCQAL